jgi:hypothetical protein
MIYYGLVTAALVYQYTNSQIQDLATIEGICFLSL